VSAGATLVLQSAFDPESVLAAIDDYDITGLLAVPTQLDVINDVQATADYDVSSLEYIRTGGSIVSEDLVERTASLLTRNVYNTYGMTEAGPNLTFAHPEWQAEHPGTVGKDAHTYELRVVETASLDEHPDPEATVGPGGQGEVIARGPGMADGYLDNEAAEEKTFFDGWIRTCDVARVDDDGFLYVVDRVDNVILSGGEKVYPAEVEQTIGTHEAVDEVCVFGVEDERWGEVVTAVVVSEAVTAETVDEYCKASDSLADFKRPRNYVVVDESLPRTDTGTLKREEIAERFVERGTRSEGGPTGMERSEAGPTGIAFRRGDHEEETETVRRRTRRPLSGPGRARRASRPNRPSPSASARRCRPRRGRGSPQARPTDTGRSTRSVRRPRSSPPEQAGCQRSR
jgi:fatty-acyl-CoA synthase